MAEPAHFWISASNIAPAGPEAPAIPGVNGSLRFLHIWAQPATMGAGPWNAATNPFKPLKNFSLNLVTNNSLVEFNDASFVVYNPMLGGARRYEFVHDSADGLSSAASLPDSVHGLQGFSVSSAATFTGVGPTCDSDDPYCGTTPSGAPAWLVASVGARAIADSGSTEFKLQIGANGMNHAGENSAQTSVVFGFDPAEAEPVYNAGLVSHRGMNLTGDDADFTLQAAPAGDFNGNGVVDAADYVVWRKTDGSQDGYNAWRTNFGQTSAGNGSASGGSVIESAAVPEPATILFLLAALFMHNRRITIHVRGNVRDELVTREAGQNEKHRLDKVALGRYALAREK